MNRRGAMKGSVVFEYPSVNEQRHEFFVKRKRVQKAEQATFETVHDAACRRHSSYVLIRLYVGGRPPTS